MNMAYHFVPFLSRVWQATLQASLVILVVLVAQWLFRNQLSPRWRHALWLLVIIRLVLPGSLESRLSVFNWLPSNPRQPELFLTGKNSTDTAPVPSDGVGVPPGTAEPESTAGSWSVWAVSIWIGGASLLVLALVSTTVSVRRKIRGVRPVTDGAVLELLEDCKQAMGVSTPITLMQTSAVRCPALFGFVRPRLLLPEGILTGFSLPELRYIFLHEVGHVRRGDVPLAWLITGLLALHWFNPLVWFACHRMRLDGELACDALALSRMGGTENKSYGRTIVKLLEGFTRPTRAPALVGILENQTEMKRRLSMIAKFKPSARWSALAASLFAALALTTLTDAQPAEDGAGARSAGAKPATSPAAEPADPAGPPRIVSTVPEVGATEVDPAITEITVTFDRDMAGGMSWTGGGPEFPPLPTGSRAKWVNKRTCAMPVKLEKAKYYRVGINSTSYRNFQSAEGVPALPSAIYFTTVGASDALKRKVSKPTIVELTPKNGDQEVDPNLKELRIMFNVPMGGGFSWTGGGPEFPTIPEGKRPFWSADKKTCVLPVELQPGSNYRLGLNSPSHRNFQSAGGVPLDPVVYRFKTKQ